MSFSFVFDEPGRRSLELLSAITEQVVGPDAPAARELRGLTAELSSRAYRRASTAFRALDPALKRQISEKANLVAGQIDAPTVDIRRQFPDLFVGPSSPKRLPSRRPKTERVWS
jgi:hypothetical protein